MRWICLSLVLAFFLSFPANVDAQKDLKALQTLNLSDCYGLANIDPQKDLEALQTLDLHGCGQLTNVDALRDLKALQTLNLGHLRSLGIGCKQPTNFDGLKDLKALQTLDLSGCEQLTNVDALKDLKALQTLDLSDCGQLASFDGLRDLKALQTLDLSYCWQLANFDALKDLKALQTLNLDGCYQLTNVDGLKDLKTLQTLNLSYCEHLANIDALKNLNALQTVDLRGCTGLPPWAVNQLRAALPQTEIIWTETSEGTGYGYLGMLAVFGCVGTAFLIWRAWGLAELWISLIWALLPASVIFGSLSWGEPFVLLLAAAIFHFSVLDSSSFGPIIIGVAAISYLYGLILVLLVRFVIRAWKTGPRPD